MRAPGVACIPLGKKVPPTGTVAGQARTHGRVRPNMPTDTLGHTSRGNIGSGPTVPPKKPRGWLGTLDRLSGITNPRDLALELIRRVDINRELYSAGMEPNQEDKESLRLLCIQWDRLRAVHSGGNPQHQPARLAGRGTKGSH